MVDGIFVGFPLYLLEVCHDSLAFGALGGPEVYQKYIIVRVVLEAPGIIIFVWFARRVWVVGLFLCNKVQIQKVIDRPIFTVVRGTNDRYLDALDTSNLILEFLVERIDIVLMVGMHLGEGLDDVPFVDLTVLKIGEDVSLETDAGRNVVFCKKVSDHLDESLLLAERHLRNLRHLITQIINYKLNY